MKKKIALIVLALHLIVSLIFPFKLHFLEKNYYDFILMFFIIYASTLPTVISLIGISFGVTDIIKKEINFLNIISLFNSAFILIISVVFAFGYFNNIEILNTVFMKVAYVFVPISCFFIVISWLGTDNDKVKDIKQIAEV